MNELEKFISKNKGELERERKPEEGWKNLERRLKKQTSYNQMIYWKAAAVFFFISTFSLLFIDLRDSDTPALEVSENWSHQPIENYYSQQINLKKEEFRHLANENENEELFRDLDQMDEAYIELKKSFAKHESEKIADAILENLRLRILILNEQIYLIRYGKREEESFHSM